MISARVRTWVRLPGIAAAAAVLTLSLGGRAFAGAPFVLDDSQTNKEGKWEIDLSASYQDNSYGYNGTAPQVEIDYGIVDTVQLGIVESTPFVHLNGGSTDYGIGDTQVILKWRFIDPDDSGWAPGIAIAPEVIAPSGNANEGLGTGHTQFFLPLWLSKNLGRWTPFGGGGYNVNPGAGNKNWWIGGAGTTFALNDTWSVGGEIFYQQPTQVGETNSTTFDLGLIYNIDDIQHILISAGRNITHDENNKFTGYLDYQLTF
jgi:hypothetical protein